MVFWQTVLLLCCSVGTWTFYSEFSWAIDRLRRRKPDIREEVRPAPSPGDHLSRLMMTVVGLASLVAIFFRNPQEGRIATALVLCVFVLFAVAGRKFFKPRR